ncbi:MAG: hypothetical protein CYPHOPRED_004141 [Cyphobasidiales sp. Tagirdzhanova-0007]|nr:MAG: hypothetical protein CYPHOPRED_004141 [Cyphobasidiales sp. Tagirdzhanova-0007]
MQIRRELVGGVVGGLRYGEEAERVARLSPLPTSQMAKDPAGSGTNTSSNRSDAPGPVPNKELIQRMNFLHQAAVLVAAATERHVPRPSRRRTSAGGEARLAKKALISTQPSDRPSSQPASVSAAVQAPEPPRHKIKTKNTPHTQSNPPAKAKLISRSIKRSLLVGQVVPSLGAVATKNLSTHYVKDLRIIARKSVLRIDPVVKRQCCRHCHTILVPGITSSVRIKPSGPHVHMLRTECLSCGVMRTIPCPPSLERRADCEAAELARSQRADPEAEEAFITGRATNVPQSPSGDVDGGDNKMLLDVDPLLLSSSASLRKPKRHRKKAHFDSIVPGTRKQYRSARFHERIDHVVWKGLERVQ